jgi:hypothetical protein
MADWEGIADSGFRIENRVRLRPLRVFGPTRTFPPAYIPQSEIRNPEFLSAASALPDTWDQPIADTCCIFVVAGEFFSEDCLLDLNTNREQTKQDTSPEKPPAGT